MSKMARRADTRVPRARRGDLRQGDLFEGAARVFPRLAELTPAAPQAPGALNLHIEARRLLARALKASPHSRDEVAERLSRLAGRPTSRAQLDAWCAPTKAHRLPADLVPALCAAIGNLILLEGLARAAGAQLVAPEELRVLRLGQLVQFRRAADAEIRRLALAS